MSQLPPTRFLACAGSQTIRKSVLHLALLIVASAVICTGCGGSGGSGGERPTVTSVSVSPASTNVQPGASQQFTATVSGTGNFPTTVVWTLSGSSDNGNLGTISATGLYTASANPPNPNTVTVRASSTLDATKSGTSSVLIGSAPFQITGVTLTPSTVTLKTLHTQQFTATVQGTGNFPTDIAWMVNGVQGGGDEYVGTLSDQGLYTAPNVALNYPVNISVYSTAAPVLSASAQINLSQGPPIITQMSNPIANAGDVEQITGTGFVGLVTVVFPGPNGTQLAVPVPIIYKPMSVLIPLSAVSGEVFVQAEFNGILQQSNGVPFTRLPRVRIRASQRDLSAGESVSFQSRIMGSGTAETLTWSADLGSVDNNGRYTAPASLGSDAFALVSACVQGTQICDQERLGLHPFRITPGAPIVQLGQSLQLSGLEGSAMIAPTWQLEGPGSLLSSGLYTASSQPADAGGIPVLATSGGVSEQAAVSVTGAFPGVVNRVADYIDLNQHPDTLGTFSLHVGLAGTRAYVLSADQYYPSLTYFWVDVYDISDPTNPVWKDAFEPASREQLLSCNDGFLYQVAPGEATPYPGVIAAFDITGAHPTLFSRQISPVTIPALSSHTGCLFTQISLDAWENIYLGKPAVIDQLSLQNGNVVHTQYTFTLPIQALQGLAGTANRVYALSDTYLSVWDITTQPPSQVGLVQAGSGLDTNLAVVGNLLFVPGTDFEEPATQVFDISAPQPVLLTTLPIGTVVASSATTVVSDTVVGSQAVDVSDPQRPRLSSTLLDYAWNPTGSAALAGDYVFLTGGDGGLAIFDLSKAGGLRPSYLQIPTPAFWTPAWAQVANSANLFFATTNSGFGGGVVAYDLSTDPPVPVGSFSTGSSVCQALALAGSYLYVGNVDSMQVLDVSNPSSLTQITSIPTGISALTVVGNVLFAGTTSGRLVVYDISQPSSPIQRASLQLPGLPIEFAVSGNLLFVADSSAGLLIYNIAVPTSPALLSQVTPSSAVTDVAIDGNLALLAAWEEGIVVVDFTNPATPKIVGRSKLDTVNPYATFQSELLNKAVTVTFLNKIAFVGVYNADTHDPPNNGNGMIYGFDYTDPTHPRLVYLGANGVGEDAILTIRAVGNRIFAGGTSTLIDFDASQPRNVINLFYPPDSLRPPPNLGLARSRQGLSNRNISKPETTKTHRQALPLWRRYR